MEDMKNQGVELKAKVGNIMHCIKFKCSTGVMFKTILGAP